MDGNRFQFKRFAIEQDGCAMKVGTDGVLLGAWCRIEPEDKTILDIGTGTGVITLQLAQRTENSVTKTFDSEAIIEAVEIAPEACEAAKRNFDASGWGSRIKLHRTSVQEFAEKATEPAEQVTVARFDHIVSNPPYFVDSLTSPDPSRRLARHADTLSYEELIAVCDKLLKPDGRISLVLPAGVETEKMIATAKTHGFLVSRRTDVHSTPKSGPKRSLLEFLRYSGFNNHNAPELQSITIQDAGPGTFSAEYRTLTRDFYLHF